jgi:hypothetical protein
MARADHEGARVLDTDLAALESCCGVAELGAQCAGQLDVATGTTAGAASGDRDLVLDVPLGAQVSGGSRASDGDKCSLLPSCDERLHEVHRLEVLHAVDRVEERLRIDAREQCERPRVDAVLEDRLDDRDVVELVDRARVVGVRRLPAVLVLELELTIELAQLGGERPLLGRRRPREDHATSARSRTHV